MLEINQIQRKQLKTQIGLFDVAEHMKAADPPAPDEHVLPMYSPAEVDYGTYSHAEPAAELQSCRAAELQSCRAADTVIALLNYRKPLAYAQ